MVARSFNSGTCNLGGRLNIIFGYFIERMSPSFDSTDGQRARSFSLSFRCRTKKNLSRARGVSRRERKSLLKKRKEKERSRERESDTSVLAANRLSFRAMNRAVDRSRIYTFGSAGFAAR